MSTIHSTRPRPGVRHLGPNWYATVMGTAIVASAGAALPARSPLLRDAYEAVWALAALALLALLVARATHWARHPDQARRHLADPAVAPFYGCLAMALMAVGGATLSVGSGVIGERAAVAADVVLWTGGTVIGLGAAAAIPYLMVTRHKVAADGASPVWLLPVVAPMVSAALGPALVPHLPAGQWRSAMVLGCYALFGMSLLATLVILPAVFSRLVHHGPLPLALTPTLFLVLGPLGQSTTAVNNLADAAQGAVAAPYAPAMAAFAVLYGVPVMGFALLWLALAGAMVVRAFRQGMGFAMTWWAFTFPLGTCVTGAAGLARHTGLPAFTGLATGLYALLVVAWAVAAARTLRGLVSGRLLEAPRPAPSVLPRATVRTT
ncbi:TDT family transporter [Streptomyces albireticuli]|uniref:C4-dicarboxylate ABC transporter n=1 Tax=Streptomyces albireticuli TaxID=1940 RepID=A0A2A2DBG9_9ACTN|nr:TDT family transporter [Streptomyces albireticuli]MCD9143388.1 TDT family transporter [Streptomyces albireticuli]MCD9164747.1 TDT family transporter [Streptomyces albireticuli]MCD9191505.1 TDT family transporter [Streptomyces albireticuli]PAU49833.1 C4-dicarboxylate ABC transporter [Streptomyces albireticuli]